MAMTSILSFLRVNALRFPNQLAVSDSLQSVSYRELWQNVQKLALWLRANGFSNGSKILVEAHPRVLFSVAALGIYLSGCVFVPIEKNISKEVFLRYFEETNARLFIGEKKIEGLFCITFENLSELLENSRNNEIVWDIPKENIIADVLFTTGTTGKSKGVILSHQAVWASADNSLYVDQLSADSIYLISSPLNHINALRKIYSCFICGAHVVLLDGFLDVKKYYETVEKFCVNVLLLPPTAIHLLLMVSWEKLHTFSEQIKVVHTNCAPMTETDKENIRRCLPNSRLIFGYGSTEGGSVCCAYDYAKLPRMVNCVGKITPHTRITIVNEEHQEINSSKENLGYLAISGISVMNGYLNDSEQTAKVLTGNTMYTNDLGYIDSNGFVFVIGRNDDVINCGGLKIAPSEVENTVMQYNDIRDCVCFGIKDSLMGVTVKLNIVLKNDHFDFKAFRNFLQNNLENYQIPSQIEIVKEIPKTLNGKIDRKRLQECGREY